MTPTAMSPAQPTDLIVALDYPSAEQARTLIQQLKGLSVIYKVGFELFVSSGPGLVQELTRAGERVFLDLKFHDIPNTVAKAAAQAATLGVEMMTLHAAGGREMFRLATDEIQKLALPRMPRLLAVTALTSFSEPGWAEVTQAVSGQNSSVAASVERMAAASRSWGATGLVCSAHELSRVNAVAPGLYTVVPGIRPAGEPTQDQARVMTPAQARAAGARAIVVGRPITQSTSPRDSAQSLLKDLQ